MSLTMVLILSAAVVIFAIIRALKSDTPIPWTIPPGWRPVIAIFLGQIGAILTSIAKAKWPNLFGNVSYEEIFGIGATGSAFSALLNGVLGAPKAIKETPMPIVKSVRPPPIVPPSELDSSDLKDDTIPAPPKTPPNIPPLGVLFVIVISIFISSCASAGPILSGITDVGSCIVNQLVAGNEDPKSIALGCAKTTVKDVGAVVDSLIADANKNKAQASDGGLMMATPDPFYARLQRVHAKLEADAAP